MGSKGRHSTILFIMGYWLCYFCLTVRATERPHSLRVIGQVTWYRHTKQHGAGPHHAQVYWLNFGLLFVIGEEGTTVIKCLHNSGI